MKVKFWGTRGSIATPQPEHVRYGGDTSCVEVRTSDKGTLLILDGGTGIRRLGIDLFQDKSWNRKGHILLSHAHWDHIQGIPFFGPAFDPKNDFTFYGQFKVDGRLEDVLRGQMEYNYFPVRLGDMGAGMKFVELVEQTITIDDVAVTTCHLPHPQGCFGYRIDDGQAVLVYMTDNELEPAGLSEKHISLARDADLLIFDTMYTEEEFARKRGWGHSTWRVGIELAERAGAKQLCMFHHSPDYDDGKMDDLLSLARKHFPNVMAATRDLEVELHGEGSGAKQPQKAPRKKDEVSADYTIKEDSKKILGVIAAASVDKFKSEKFRNTVLGAMHSGLRAVYVDLDALPEIDSLALGTLATFIDKARDLDVHVCVKDPSPLVKEVLLITRFDQVVEFVSSKGDVPPKKRTKAKSKG